MYEPIHTELVNFMRSVPEQLRTLSDATVSTCTQRVSNDINKDMKVMQTNLLKTLRENIKAEVSHIKIITKLRFLCQQNQQYEHEGVVVRACKSKLDRINKKKSDLQWLELKESYAFSVS